jgi:hypothetical protein
MARDDGCVVPGCGIPADWCDVHHVIPWSQGGSTDVEGMCLVCPRHHTAIHAGVWQIIMCDGMSCPAFSGQGIYWILGGGIVSEPDLFGFVGSHVTERRVKPSLVIS